MRPIRSYLVRRARTEHHCDRCCHPIRVGQSYEADVFGGRTIIVMKIHLDDPQCDLPTEPAYEGALTRREPARLAA
jgi:hypothetical protein